MLRLALGPHGMLTTPRLADAAGRRSRSANAQQFAQISDALRLQQVQHLLPYSGREERVGQRVVRVLHVEAVELRQRREVQLLKLDGQVIGIRAVSQNPAMNPGRVDGRIVELVPGLTHFFFEDLQLDTYAMADQHPAFDEVTQVVYDFAWLFAADHIFRAKS